MALSATPIPALLQKHLKLANIQDNNIREKLEERRLVQIVAYLELVSMKLRHRKIHKEHFRARIHDNIEMTNHWELLKQIQRNGSAE